MFDLVGEQVYIEGDLDGGGGTSESSVSLPFWKTSMVVMSMILFGWMEVVVRMSSECAKASEP